MEPSSKYFKSYEAVLNNQEQPIKRKQTAFICSLKVSIHLKDKHIFISKEQSTEISMAGKITDTYMYACSNYQGHNVLLMTEPQLMSICNYN